MAKADVDQYINNQPKGVQSVLQEIRKVINQIVKTGTEGISYGIPTIYINGKYLIYFAGFKNHVSLYPITDEDAKIIKGLEKYKAGKGTVRFPLNEPIPLKLIEEVVKLKVSQRNI